MLLLAVERQQDKTGDVRNETAVDRIVTAINAAHGVVLAEKM